MAAIDGLVGAVPTREWPLSPALDERNAIVDHAPGHPVLPRPTATVAFSASVHFRRRSTRVMTSTLSMDPPSGLQKDSPGRADFREHHQQRNAAEAGRLRMNYGLE